ncbi:MAG TPA: hypothetical protein VEA19_00870 [Actinomycetota bacterium]|nr:hypothetical protein [Actinomycetota bacterium]
METSGIYVWATDAAGPLTDYEQVEQISDTQVFSDGVRVVWQVHGLNVWAESATPATIEPGQIVELVEISRRVPFP